MEPTPLIELSDDEDKIDFNVNITRKPISLTTNEPEVIELYVFFVCLFLIKTYLRRVLFDLLTFFNTQT